MTNLCFKALQVLQGKTLVTAESCTGGGIGSALTAVPGSSCIYKGGIICYTNWVKQNLLGVDAQLLASKGAVSAPVAEAMAAGARIRLEADVAISVTGLAGPDGDDFGNPVGTVFIGYSDGRITLSRGYLFSGDREQIRQQAIRESLNLLIEKSVDN